MGLVKGDKINESTAVSHAKDSFPKLKNIWRAFQNLYDEEIPGSVGFFTLANPIAAVADTMQGVPAANGGFTRLVVTAAGLVGLQHGISSLRKKIYYHFDIYNRSETVKRVTDFTYGALVGAMINPPFHEVTKKVFQLQESTDFHDAVVTGAIVGGLTGLIGWMGSDGFSYAWERRNIPTRRLHLPGVEYVKQLSKSTKKVLALGATVLSLAGTSAWYAHRGALEYESIYSRPLTVESRLFP